MHYIKFTLTNPDQPRDYKPQHSWQDILLPDYFNIRKYNGFGRDWHGEDSRPKQQSNHGFTPVCLNNPAI